MKIPKLLLAVIGLAALCGCTTAIKHGNVIAVKTRFFGLHVTATSTTTASPEVQLGWGSSTVFFVPTSTNHLFSAPYADTYDLSQGISPFSTRISEDAAFGAVAVTTNGSTALPNGFARSRLGTNGVSSVTATNAP